MRVSWKIPMISRNFSKKNIYNKSTWIQFLLNSPNLRNLTIPKSLVGRRLYISNGKLFKIFVISSLMKGHKFGEFSITKTLGLAYHLAREKKKKKRKK